MFSNLSFYNALFPIFFLLCLSPVLVFFSVLILGEFLQGLPMLPLLSCDTLFFLSVSFIHPGGRNGPWIQACTYLHSGTVVTVVSEMVMLSVSHRAFAYTFSLPGTVYLANSCSYSHILDILFEDAFSDLLFPWVQGRCLFKSSHGPCSSPFHRTLCDYTVIISIVL